ncbi:hypothetical protein HGRIS_002499 [Hohenbuehelia grisea]|uniref:F-box domain-containing protein n=1 Tax=Hohenbuehelia grisea TaxID=104357 RepID=A0ABR3JL59_9AGAR
MADNKLPAELWIKIFDLAADEDVIYQFGLPTMMAQSAWFKNILSSGPGGWTLRSPQEALNLLQRRSYATKKAIISTCRFWRQIGTEFLYRCLFFDTPHKLKLLAEILASHQALHGKKAEQSSPSPGWWTKRIHLARYFTPSSQTPSTIESSLATIIENCPNLEIFIVDWPMPSVQTFGRLADVLATTSHSTLRTVHWHVSAGALPKVIWALDSLPLVLSAHIAIDSPRSEDEDENLGAAFDLHLTLPHLQQLSLKGHIVNFLEQATGWKFPSLRSLSIDTGSSRVDQPDVISFLTAHGMDLLLLDVHCIPPLDVPSILDLCPFLVCFAFNADWRMDQQGNMIGGNDSSVIANRPHANLRFIGLHGLMYAFGVGFAAQYTGSEPLNSRIIRRTNDLNIDALNKRSFPKLEVVRCLSNSLLNDLNKADGPSKENGGFERWDRWWGNFARMNVRFEDCTGQPLGTLPIDEDEEGDSESEEDEEWEDWELEIPPMPRDETPINRELRDLVEECRAMNESLEEEGMPNFGSMSLAGAGSSSYS